jgi:hypothetical protein
MSHASSNKRELVAIHKALEAFAPIIRSNKWETIQNLKENTTSFYNINHLASADTLYHSLRCLLTLTDILNIRIFSAHIQGILNTEPDKLSRLALSGDYSLKEQALLAGLETLRVCPQLDLFATKENRWYTHFCSLKRNVTTPGYLGNAMHLLWPKNKILLLHPPSP